jgi:hypothetical protein
MDLRYTKNRCQWLTLAILATQEDHSSKLALANSSRDPISKKPFTKKAGRVTQG